MAYDSASTWTTLGTTYSNASAIHWQGDDLYAWNINVTPVPNSSETNRWPSGRLARFRVLYDRWLVLGHRRGQRPECHPGQRLAPQRREQHPNQ